MKNLQWCPNGQPDYGIDEVRGEPILSLVSVTVISVQGFAQDLGARFDRLNFTKTSAVKLEARLLSDVLHPTKVQPCTSEL